jgi:hypothetical protein
MAETPATRRHFLRTGALAAGTVWAAPTIESLRVLQAPGSPPPSSTTTTTTSRTFTFSNNEFVTFVPTEGHPRCSGGDLFGVAFRISSSELGEGDVTILACHDRINNYNPPFNIDLIDGLVTIVFGSGVLTGTGSGRIFLEFFPPFPLSANREVTHLDIEFTGGTGALAGATGVATFDRRTAFPPLNLPATTQFSGSITVPGA